MWNAKMIKKYKNDFQTQKFFYSTNILRDEKIPIVVIGAHWPQF